eukprot:Blabericola_migrator_1__6419@NODE_3237_length_1923_cov_351_242996_g2028_i0_p1_GENE_NODE_3237_length_1923_cov_351_242996_g2028_i0NODE_3237_length_1923_cov_351_242996_g2028_i0_p1_ORF_typecomplete_len328_score64_44Ldh_1_C/PF02866_18/8_9e42Ldh_1_N/PF00056_23/1_7e40Ldh_1_N/PF00056_23/6_5e03Glyco_hydro_4/PF02056_16/0_02Glyco_hydro_4/PF02056_16/0_00067UDPG_MGDP_dh_N/PF03721_14/0_014AlaDh_PNT_C/PF01262_21/0_069Glyco_hydro_3_C/PF01915_22/0_26Glyco_hydro_3_C/PF01915_22/1_9e03_NODE_3237_length_1923_cov_351
MSNSFNPKIALVGAGQIGGMLAVLSGLKKLSSNIVLLDVVPDMPKGKALDLSQAMAAEGISVAVDASSDLSEGSPALKDSDIVIVTAGFPRKPGMSRDDLLLKNAEVVSNVGRAIGTQCPNAFVVCITNPLDVMVGVLQKASGLPPHRVVGMAGILDTSRFRYFLAQELGVSTRDIQAMVLGGHGDDMVPLRNYTSVAGVPLMTLIKMGRISEARVAEIVQRTRMGGGEIVGLLKMGSAFVAPASSAIAMVEAYLRDEKRILPCCAYLNGEYNVSGMYGGVPVVIGAGGVEQILELPLEADEKNAFERSMAAVAELREVCLKAGHAC